MTTHTTPEIERWQAAEAKCDQLQAEEDGLDEPEALLLFSSLEAIDAERERLAKEIADADDEIEEAELAYYRAEGDAGKVAKLESSRLNKEMMLAGVFADEVDQVYAELQVQARDEDADTLDILWHGRDLARLVVEDSDDDDAVDLDDAIEAAKRKLAAQIVASPPPDQDDGSDDLYIA